MKRLIRAVNVVLDSADNTGCSEDLIVVSADAIEELEKALSAYAAEASGQPVVV